MKNMLEDFETILFKEEKNLENLSETQKLVKNSVMERDWEKLMLNITELNRLSDDFVKIDETRDELQKKLSEKELSNYYEKLGKLRAQLLKCKVENRVLSEYVNVAKDFIQEVVQKAIPQARNKNYSRTGKFIQPQPQSVVVNQLF